MKRQLRKTAGIATGVLSFAYLIFVINPIQVLSLVILPFSKRGFRAVNRWCARSIWGFWVLHAEVQNRIDIRVVGDRPRPRENTMVISNHQSMADVMVLLCLAWRCGRLGDMKVFVKDIVKYFPGVGWGMLFLDCIFVKRNWAQDQAQIDRLFGKFKRDEIPLFLVSFLEGTRLTQDKQAKAREFAKDRNLPVPEHTLVPRTKGFVASVGGLREHLDAVYDLTIGYHADPAPTLASSFAGDVRRVDIHIKRHPIHSLPKSEAELTEWAQDRFREKDQLLAHFREHGAFPGPELDSKVRLLDWFRGDRQRSAGLATNSPKRL